MFERIAGCGFLMVLSNGAEVKIEWSGRNNTMNDVRKSFESIYGFGTFSVVYRFAKEVLGSPHYVQGTFSVLFDQETFTSALERT